MRKIFDLGNAYFDQQKAFIKYIQTSFKEDFKTIDLDDALIKEELLFLFYELFKQKTYHYLAFDWMLKIDPRFAIQAIIDFYLGVNIKLQEHNKDHVNDLDLLLSSLTEALGEDKIFDLLQTHKQIGVQNLSYHRTQEILVDLFGVEKVTNLLLRKTTPKQQLSLKEIRTALEELLDGKKNRAEVKIWMDNLYFDDKNGLVTFENETVQSVFQQQISILSNIDLKTETGYYYDDDFIQELIKVFQ